MRRLEYVRRGELRHVDAPMPSLESDGDAIVQPVAATTCDLDRAIIAGLTPFEGPFALGHEAVGEVIEVGDGIVSIAPGKLVVVPWHVCCGTCTACAGSSAPTLNISLAAAGTSIAARDQRRDVVDVRERARLRAVAEDRHRLVLHDLVHEDPDHVAVAVADVLVLAVDVVRTEDRVVEPEHLVRGAQVELDRVLGDAVRVLGLGHQRPRSSAAGPRRRRRSSS